MCAEILRTDATDGVKKTRNAHWRTPASGQNKTCILLRGVWIFMSKTSIKTSVWWRVRILCKDAPTYMEKIPLFRGKYFKVPSKDWREGLRILLKTSVRGGLRCRYRPSLKFLVFFLKFHFFVFSVCPKLWEQRASRMLLMIPKNSRENLGPICNTPSKWHNFCSIWILPSLRIYIIQKVLYIYTGSSQIVLW